jgi:hypothetical protein
VFVDGCGIEQVNGTYRQVGIRDNIPNYSMKTFWNGQEVEFILYHWVGSDWSWFLRIKGGRDLYRASGYSKLPPMNGWRAVEDGVDPAPQITLEEVE